MWIIYPFRKDSNGKQGVAKLLYDLGPKARDTVAITHLGSSDITADGNFAYFTLTTADHIAANWPPLHQDHARPATHRSNGLLCTDGRYRPN